jgi:hypothetical protein
MKSLSFIASKRLGQPNLRDFAEIDEAATTLQIVTSRTEPQKTKITPQENRSIHMRAIIIKQFGGLDSLVIENLPDPEPKPGNVLIQVKAFGINHAETHMRKAASSV